MVQTISGREKIDRRWCEHQSPFFHYWQHFDCNCVHITWQRQMNDGAGNGRGITYTENNDTAHFYLISDEKKKVVARWVPHMLFSVQKQHYMELCQKHLARYKKEGIVLLQQIIAIDETWVCDFKPKLKTQSAIFKGESSQRLQKFWHQASKVKQNDLWLSCCNFNILGAIYSYSGPACVCILPSQNFEAYSSTNIFMLNHVIILHGNICPHIATLVTTIFQKYGWWSTIHLVVLIWISETTTYSKNSRKCSVGFVSVT